MNVDKIERHLEHLQQRHDEYDKLIKDMFNSYGDNNVVNFYKKKKLQIKDEIERLSHSK